MQALKDKIQREGHVLSDTVLKVDAFLNHQVDPNLMLQIGQAFADLYQNAGVTKILTLESSGIAPAVMAALILKVPLVIAKKQKSLILQEELYVEKVYSFTKQVNNDITVSRKFLSSSDRVLIIDDFLAHGEAAFGMARIVEKSQAAVVGIGIVIEKSFQEGAKKLKAAGYRVDSLVRIESLHDGKVIFASESAERSKKASI